MFRTYAELLWKTPFWVAVGVALLCATAAWVRASRRAAAAALTIAWLLGFAWAFGFMWSWSAYRNEQMSPQADSARIAAAADELGRAQMLGLVWGGVFAFSLGGYLRARLHASSQSSSLHGRLKKELLKKVVEKNKTKTPPKPDANDGGE
jgi:hypothetical protein